MQPLSVLIPLIWDGLNTRFGRAPLARGLVQGFGSGEKQELPADWPGRLGSIDIQGFTRGLMRDS